MEDDAFEWDDEKAVRNFRKHGVAFETARACFADPDFLDEDDPDPDEERFRRICMYQGGVYVIAYAERSQRIRIISARRANRHERQRYFDR